MKFIDNCKENVIEFLKGSEQATVTFSQGRYISKIRTLARDRPDECEIIADNKDGSICAHIPTKWVKLHPTRTVELSEEQKQKMRERLANARVKRKEQDCKDNK